MPIIHIDLKEVVGDYVTLRYFLDEPSDYLSSPHFTKRNIAELNHIAQRDYYVEQVVEYSKTGQDLYNWLDGSDRILENLLDSPQWGEVTVLAIATAENLAHLPWELLHDGNEFLVERQVVPVRWVSSKKSKKLTIQHPKKERALQVLFMASSPIGEETLLDYEAEERGILAATETAERQRSIELVVEESGSLEGLNKLLSSRNFNYFDILHLTGHTSIKNGKRCFIAEKITGEPDYVSAQDIVKQIKSSQSQPQLIFLSACNTGKKTGSGTVLSMSETLIRSGAKAVLGWGKSVLDENAILAAKVLYEQLSLGRELTQAVASTYEELIEKKARDWHLLRLYTAGTLPGELVTSLVGNSVRTPAPPPSVAPEFLDPEGRVKVATRESFVGRRRHLQNCLRTFQHSIDKVGVLIYGMGGLGKSSLAARLCDRYLQRERVVWVGKVNLDNLANVLADKLDDQEQRNQLKNSGEGLKHRLKRVFDQSSGRKSFLLVLDDFENNLEPRNDNYVLTPEAASVLSAIVEAIQETYSSHRIIITCRYDFDFTKSHHFYKQPLDALRGADLQKKWNRLPASDNIQIDEILQSQVEKLADGNPRLLEKLHEELNKSSKFNQLNKLNKSNENSKKLKELQVLIYNELKANLSELLGKEEVLDKLLRDQIEKDSLMRDMLQRGLVFELPVPKDALKAVCETVDELDECIDKAVKLGLLEASYDWELLRVPRYLGLEKLDEISLNKKAAKELYDLWYEQAETKTKISEERLLEIHRLAKLGDETEIQVTMTEILATRWKDRNLFRKVVELCTETLKDLEKVHSDVPSNQVARVRNVLGNSNLLLGYYQNAKDQYEKALMMGEQLEEKSLDFAQTLNGLGYLYILTKDYDKAKQRLDEALNIINRNTQQELFNKVQDWRCQEKLPIKLECLSYLAYCYREQKKWQEARFLYVKALWMCKRLPTEENITLAESYHNLATVYYEQDVYKKAEAWYRAALKLSQGLLGEEHLTTANILSSLGKVYLLQKRYDDARYQFRKALNIKIKMLETHIDIVYDLKHLGYTNDELKKDEEAYKCYRQALEMIEMLRAKKDPSINNNDDMRKVEQELKNRISHL
ncbi:tetratricopeptide repeat protein [Scytonema hofmannii FACHB-248]|uniref:Tetratricopeptide repeat protein n=1 Tax=Scytonema hofmannii FACHB-248 TaxID=1842502 RepID=A0ABR8GMC0_9CYAN|nr:MULTISPECIES: tetratricopeptide repeat protein [Nostocales]MBD2604313.1 tetratricopeptide repeat protein [Scytonema hofmannii FACHB-248]